MNTQRQFATFMMVGGLNTLFGYSCYVFFVFIGLSYAMAVLLSTSLGVLFNYKTTGKLVFGNTSNKFFLKFLSSYGIVYCLNIALIKIMSVFTDNLYLAGLASLLPAAMLAFVLNKYVVFRERYEIN